MVKGKVILFSLLLIFATSLYAGEVDDCNSQVYFENGCTFAFLFSCPAADAYRVDESCNDDSYDFIRVIAKDSGDNGIAGIPWTDYWLDACDGAQALFVCAGGITADSLTNSDGETSISDEIGVGGCVLTDGVYLAIQNVQIMDPDADPVCSEPVCLPIVIKSPDLTKDGFVNVSDQNVFSDAWGTQVGDTYYNECCNFNRYAFDPEDIYVNLSDLGYVGDHWQHECR